MLCRKCGFNQENNNVECAKCGVIFSKLYQIDLIDKKTNFDNCFIKNIRSISNDFKNNNENKYKLIYKCINDNIYNIAISNLKNETEKKLFLNLIYNKLKYKKSVFIVKPIIFLSILIFTITTIIYLYLK